MTRRGNVLFVSECAVSWLKELELTPAALVERFLAAERAGPFALATRSRRLWVSAAGANRKGSICLILETLPAPRGSLSAREAEALYWVCHGKSNDQIAELMRIKICTVRKHLQRMFSKLGVDNRTAAASYGELFSLAALPAQVPIARSSH